MLLLRLLLHQLCCRCILLKVFSESVFHISAITLLLSHSLQHSQMPPTLMLTFNYLSCSGGYSMSDVFPSSAPGDRFPLDSKPAPAHAKCKPTAAAKRPPVHPSIHPAIWPPASAFVPSAKPALAAPSVSGVTTQRVVPKLRFADGIGQDAKVCCSCCCCYCYCCCCCCCCCDCC